MLRIYLLVSCICVLIASLLYIFYWNRFIASLISFALRIKYWNQGGSSIWVQIGSIHFSLLAGRILLKDVQYHSSNQTIKVVKAQIVWRYWLRQPATENDLNRAHVGGEDFRQTFQFPSCRIKVSIQGLEWFLYNRTAAFDNIISQMQSKIPSFAEPRTEPHRMFSKTSGFDVSSLYPPSFLPTNVRTPQVIHAALDWVKRQMPYLDPKDLLPIAIEGFKGAIICGNPSVPNCLVAEFHRVEGTFGIVQSRSKHDLYKQLLNIKFQNAVIRMVNNDAYQRPMLTIGHDVHHRIESSRFADVVPLSYLSFRSFSKIWRHLKFYNLFSKSRHRSATRRAVSHVIPGRRSFKSLDEDMPADTDFANLEYAIEREVLEAPTLEMSYYVDVVGDVPGGEAHTNCKGRLFDIGNGDLPPEWGIDIVVRSGFIRYGPWADRQRAHLQRIFFPSTYHDLEQTPTLKPGDKRLWTALNFFVELREETTLYIPFREASKNWQWDGKAGNPRPRKREAASIHVTTGDSSTISYTIPMVIGPKGYDSRLEVHLDTITATSSLNDIKLLVAESCRVHGELPSPLKWNDERQWAFSVTLRQPVLYILRDHINMFTDLSRDWTSGPPTPPNQFVPMLYSFDLELHNFQMHLYANDQNIIDKPLIKEENSLIIVRAPRLHFNVTIPSNKYRPEATTIPFFLEVHDVYVSLSLPRWNTQSLYSARREHRLIRAGQFQITASYHYYSEVHVENVEQLKLDILTRDVAYKALGWSVRYFMVLRDNYLGSFTHFSTLTEYLDKRNIHNLVGDPLEMKYRPEKANMLQVEISLLLENGSVLLPAAFPGYERHLDVRGRGPSDSIGACVLLAIPELQLDFRLHDYFMEMSLNLGTLTGRVEDDCSVDKFLSNGCQFDKEMFIIEGLDITANRLFGPQPRTRTYVCIWEIGLGHVRATMSALQSQILGATLDTFRLNFTDLANAPASDYGLPVDPDVTFVKLSLKALNVTLIAGLVGIDLSLPQGLTIHTNDLAGRFYSKVVCLRLPSASLKMLLMSGSLKKSWTEVADCVLDLNLDMYNAPPGWESLADAQRDFIHSQDAPTQRARFLFEQLKRQSFSPLDYAMHHNSFYLPPSRLPQCLPHSRPGRRSYTQLEGDGGTGTRWSRVSHLSESEGEENISEADRDARLAKSRFKAPIVSGVVDEYEQSMSGGDESDNEDLTDSESLESEASLSERQQHRRSLLMRYYHVTKHFTDHFLESPSQREQSPFILFKDSESPASRRYSRSLFTPTFGQANTVSPIFQDIQYSTTVRIDCTKGVEVHVTPLILSVASILIEELQQNVLSAELSLDAMMANYLSTIPSPQKSKNGTLLDIRVSLISVQIPEQILVVDQYSPTVVAVDGSSQPTQNLLGMIELFSSGCHIVCGKKADTASESWALQVKFETMSLIMWGLSDKNSHSKGSVLSDRAINILKVTSFRGELAQGAVNLTLGELSIELGNDSPRYTAAMYTAVMQDLQELSRIFGIWRQHTLTTTQRLIYQVLKLTKDRPVVDLLSTIQPSFLVQSGRPQELRTDVTFKFFFHLRTSLASLDSLRSGSLPSIPNSDSDVPLNALQLLLGSCLNALTLDADASDTIASSLLKMLFPGEMPLKATSRNSLPSITGLQVGRLNITIYDDLHKSPSQFTMTSFTTQLHTYKLPQAALSSRVTFSYGSPRDHGNESIRRTVGAVSAGDLNIVVSPHLMTFAQHMLHTRRQFTSHVAETPDDNKVESSKVFPPFYNVWLVSLHKFQFQAAAENLIFEFGGSKLTILSSTLSKSSPSTRMIDQSDNLSILFGDIFLRARSKQKGHGPPNQDVLASLTFSRGKFTAAARQDPSSNTLLRLIISLDGICLAVPRSAIRLYRFIEEWRADFLPGMETTVKTFLTELKSTEAKPLPKPSSPLTKNNSPDIRITGRVTTVGISLQVMHGTWLSWDIHNMTILLSSGIRSVHLAQSFEIQLGSQILSISHKPQNSEDSVHSPHVKLRLPALSLAGRRHSQSFINIIASLDFMVILVKPSHWDTLLAVQQKFGHDFADLVDLIEETRRKRATSFSQRVHQPSVTVRYSGHLRLKGFRLGLEGPSSTFYLGCEDVGGDINNRDGRTWQVKLCDLTLSLDPRAITTPPETGFNRNHRSAFVIIDLHIHAGTQDTSQVLQFNVTKIQAVMQPSSIGELGDFVDYLQIEMLDRREQRAADLAAFKEKTRSVLKTFEIKSKNVQSESKTRPSWLSQHIINVSIHNLGVAFPLTLDQDLELPRTASRDTPSVRAFLFSVKSIKFSAQRGEAGELVTRDLSFQFVPHFRQSVSGDFTGGNHHTRNRLLYPEMTAQVRSDYSFPSRHIWVSANVSGFILDLDSSIPDFVFSLIDVYRQGKERMMRLTGSIPRSFASREQTIESDSAAVDNTINGALPEVPTSMAFASLTFQSGQVHVHTGAAPHLSRAKSQSLSFYDSLDDYLSVHEAESIKLPVVSVWGEYRASIATHKPDNSQPSILVFKSTIHSSHNTLKPTLLPFITEIVDYVQIRMRKASRQSTDTFSLIAPDASAPINSIQNNLPQAPSSLQINLSLRIDQSKLELTCQPDVNVTAGLRWDSGGFVVNISPGAHRVTFTGSVDGLTAGLKHGFLSEDCVNLDARNLAFTSAFGKTEDEEGNVESSISLVLDTDLSGGVRFSRLQDVLCFKAVWLDHIPLFISQTSHLDKPRSLVPVHSSSSSTPAPKQELTTLILIRLRQIKLDIDLGQSISNVVFNLRNAILRSKFSEASSEVSLSVAEVTILAKGNISGHIHVPDCVFQTIRRKEESVLDSSKATRMLELSMTSGPLSIDVDSDHQRLLHYWAEPLQVDIHDDWSSISPHIRGKDHPLILSFTVVGTAVVAVATIGAIPKLLSYAHKFTSNLDAQRAGASRESVAFRVTQSPKPDNPLSEVANAMLHSARNRFKEAETELSYVIRQHMSFQLASLRLILFPRAMTDLEMAHFIGFDVHASLDRIVTDGLPSWREVYLSFSTMTISKFSQPHQFLPSVSPLPDTKVWLESLYTHTTEAIIVGLPSMKMHMVTEELIEELTKDLYYDFHSEFVRQRDGKNPEDIYITLNVSLYSWLTILRKNLSREMEQIQSSVDWRNAPTSVPVHAPRKKGPGAADHIREEHQGAEGYSGSSSLSTPSSTILISTPSPNCRTSSSVDIGSDLHVKNIDSQLPDAKPRMPKYLVSEPTGDSGMNMLPAMTVSTSEKRTNAIVYIPRERHIERLTMRQLGEATPDVMHPFFMKKAGFNLEDSLPQYVHEYATIPLEEIMEALLKLYSKQLRTDT